MIDVTVMFCLLELIHDHFRFRIDATPIYVSRLSGRTPFVSIYIDIAHRALLLYSFAALVMAEMLRYSPHSEAAQVWMAGFPLFFFVVTIARYVLLGIENKIDNQYREQNFMTTWGMCLLIASQIGGFTAILWGFFQAQIFASSSQFPSTMMKSNLPRRDMDSFEHVAGFIRM